MGGGEEPATVVGSLMFLLSFILQLGGSTALAVLLLRLTAEESSLGWYQNYPGIACAVLFPRYTTRHINLMTQSL